MKIKVFNKHDLKNYVPEEEDILIRVTSQLPFSKVKYDKYKSVHLFGFEDLDYECSYSINKEEALSVLKIILNLKETNSFIVSCDYGQSRSPAMAICVDELINNVSYSKLRDEYPDYNRYVIDMIKNSYEELKEIYGNKESIISFMENKKYEGEIYE